MLNICLTVLYTILVKKKELIQEPETSNTFVNLTLPTLSYRPQIFTIILRPKLKNVLPFTFSSIGIDYWATSTINFFCIITK